MIVALLAVALSTLIVYPLAHVAPVVSLSVVYLPAVLVVSVTWGAGLGVATGLLSAAAFNFFHLRPVGRFSIEDTSNWVALGAFLVVALLASSVAEVTRARTRDAEERRREADLAAEMATLLLRGASLHEDLPTAAARLAQALELTSSAIEMDAVEADERTVAFPLREGTRRLGTLLVGADASEAKLRRLQERIVPALEALMSAALERETLLGGVVETAALRRADTVKTALLRAVSHDLRSPLTAISAAGEAVGSPSLSPEERQEMAAVIQEESKRLSGLVDNLLDLSRLEAGAAEPHREWTSIEELIRSAVLEMGAASDAFALSLDRELPLVSVDPAQMERAFVNVLEERAASFGRPSGVRARPCGAAPVGGETPGPRRPRGRRRGRWRQSCRRRSGRRARALAQRPCDRTYRRSRSGYSAGAARARVRAVLPVGHRRRSAPRIGARACDRPRLHRGERRDAARRVPARPRRDVRIRAAPAGARCQRRAGRRLRRAPRAGVGDPRREPPA